MSLKTLRLEALSLRSISLYVPPLFIRARLTTVWRRAAWLVLAAVLSACGGSAPSIALLSGERLSLPELRGRWVVVNYWAQWCKPCAEEIPELNQFARQHGEAVLVLGVNFDGVTGDELRRQSQAFAIDFPVAVEDPAALLGLPRPSALPTTFVLDPEGNLHRTLLGPQTESTLELALQRPVAGAAGTAAP
ncbi:TlpA family protein disulfide reductase [Exilibacterium tricleocarpae]|uniref:TlpA family protein disulfide reductase n=2 Tax=Exilibacterium tricleocarpae TaxID=2591008 RepID=A0A545UBL9_9GAMM|nr:TlpA family protein disulfide reductase [Exilibacterium tricleocarpae]